MNSGRRTEIVVLGAGFGGVQVAQDLARKLKPSQAHVTLIDQNNFLLYTPMLTEVLSGQVDMMHIVAPARDIHPRISFKQGRVEQIDIGKKETTIMIGGTGLGDPLVRQQISADHLVIALGSVPNFYKIPGMQDNALTIDDLCDAVAIHNRALGLLERASMEPDESLRRNMLTFIVGGGGFSGTETAAALHDMLCDICKFYPRISRNEVRVILIEALPRLLTELSMDLATYALRKLRDVGVEVMLETKIVRANATSIELGDGQTINAHTIIWAGGVQPASVVRRTDCDHGRHGSIKVDPTCQVSGNPGVWVIGDCAEIPQPGEDKPYGPTAQNATREGALVAKNIMASLAGKEPRPFTYKPIGEVAALGRRSGVASLKGIHISGFPAWFLWRTIYLFKLPHLRRKAHVAMDWTLDLLFGREIVEMPASCFVAGVCPVAIESSLSEE
ncbi:MAG: NAD(P)/FAD-dependent oxidoreductase [Armatimonadota bacterium]|nr:NAD(P)/FAD-dependent oxidoreductase [bacterium]